MALTIGDEAITCNRAARRVPGEEQRRELPWLSDRHLDENGAITAMVLADLTAHGDVRAGRQLSADAEDRATELSTDPSDILTETGRPPGGQEADRSAQTPGLEAAG